MAVRKTNFRTGLALERNVVVLGVTSMIATFGNYTWAFFLPLYYEQVFGASPFIIGIIYAAWFAMIGLGSTPAGSLADRYGRKPIVVLAGIISASGVLVLAFSHSFILAAIAFPLAGFGTGFLQVSNVIVTESVEKERRGTAMGTFQTFTYIMASISPIVGGVTLFNGNDFFPLFIFGAVLALVATAGRALFVKETLPPSEETASSSSSPSTQSGGRGPSFFNSLSKIFGERVLLALLIAYSFYNLIIDQQSFVVPLYSKTVLGLDYRSMGALLSAVVLVSAISRLPFGKLSDQIGRLKTIIISWVGESTVVFVFVFAPRGNLPIALLGISLWILFGVIDGPAVNAWLADRADPKSRGLSMGVFYSATTLISVPAFAITGFLYTVNPQLPFFANSFIGVGCLILLIALTWRQRE